MNDPRTPAAAPRVGFIGWGPASSALLETLRERFPGIGNVAHRLEAGLPPGAGPALKTTPSLERLFALADFLFVEVSSEEMERLLPTMRLAITDRHIVVCLSPGWSLQRVLIHLHERKLVRCLLQRGGTRAGSALAYYASPFLAAADLAAFRELFADLGLLLELRNEAAFEAVQALGGIAPAVFSTAIEAMADGALTLGLPRPQAVRFLAAMLIGSARSLMEGGQAPALLRERALEREFAAAGLIEFEAAGVRGVLMRIVQQAIRDARRGESQS